MRHQLLLLVMLLLPLTASADESGTCGDNLTWTYVESSKTLTISGSGAMMEYRSSAKVPWFHLSLLVEKVEIEYGVTSIGNDAFSWFMFLKSVTIPNSVTSIGENAFDYCSSLMSVVIPNSVISIGKYAFSGCKGLISMTIGNGVLSIGEYAFEYCSNLNSIEIPNSVTFIGDFAFSGCSALTSVNIPKGVTSIGSSVFSGCSTLKSVIIPNSVTSIGSWAFSDCSSLDYVVLGSSIKNISYKAFENDNISIYCYAVDVPKVDFNDANTLGLHEPGTSLHVPAVSLEAYKSTSPWNEFGNIVPLTEEDPKPTDIISPNEDDGIPFGDGLMWKYVVDTKTLFISGNGAIPDGAHWGNLSSSIEKVVIENGITSIGNNNFCFCYNLTSISIPNSVTSIGENAFQNCLSLTTIIIPNGVTTIKDQAFSGCANVKKIYLPSSITSIGNYAFYPLGMIYGGDFYCYATEVPLTGEQAFYVTFTHILATLHVPEGSIGKYMSASQWEIFGSIVPIGDDEEYPTGVPQIKTSEFEQPSSAIFNINGHRISEPQKGLNIIRSNNGKIKKVIVK